MENLKKVIEQTENQIRQAKEKRQTAEVEQFAELDKEILQMELHLKRLKESEYLQRLRKKKQAPMDAFTQAKLHVMELTEQLSDEMVDVNGRDPRLIASFRLGAMIDRLEMLKMVNAPADMEFQPSADFTAQFNDYITVKNEKVKMAREKIASLDSEIQHLETLLADATAAGNPEEIIEYSESLENARKTREYLEPMVREAEQSQTFPDGTISAAWKEICDLYRDEWLLRIEIINTAQQIYHQAIEELTHFMSRLKSLRYEMQRIGKENGSTDEIVKYNQILTKGIDITDIRQVSQNDREMLYRAVYHNRQELL